mgnify:CR=1 FL=1
MSGIPMHYRSLLPLKTPISRDLKWSCLFSAMNMGRPQKGVLLSKESTLAGGFFVVLRRYIVICFLWICTVEAGIAVYC